MILFGWRPPPLPSSDNRSIALVQRCNTYPVYSQVLDPTYQEWKEGSIVGLHGTNYVWQIPALPKAILFLAHGCICNAMVFWDPHSKCPTCIGLPKECAFVIEAIQCGYTVIAVSSIDVCWNFKEDAHSMEIILREWIQSQGLGLLHIVVLGSSTGGYFISQLARGRDLEFQFHAFVLMVAEGRFNGASNMTASYPPVMFIHMPKDDACAKQVRVDMVELAAVGVQVSEFMCREVLMFPTFFSRRIPYIDNCTSSQMVEALAANHTLNAANLMKQGAQWFDWSLPLKDRDLLHAQLRSHVEQELNVAFAFHEFSSFAAPEIFQWFDHHILTRNHIIPTHVP